MRPFGYASTRMLGEQRHCILFELLPAGLRYERLSPSAEPGHALRAVPTFLRLSPAAARDVAILVPQMEAVSCSLVLAFFTQRRQVRRQVLLSS